MSKVSISEAIRLVGISRSQFYTKYINKGIISVQLEDDKKVIDISELIRVFGNVQLVNSPKEQLKTSDKIINISTDKDKLIAILENQLSEAKIRELEFKDRETQLRRETQEREDWFKLQLEKANNLLEDKTNKPRKKFLGIF
jgi:hypothetical protein